MRRRSGAPQAEPLARLDEGFPVPVTNATMINR